MKFSIDSLREAGAFTGAPVREEITWECSGQEYTATVYVRRLSYSSAVSEIRAFNDKTDDVAARIAASICDEAGAPIFTPEIITGEADPDQGPLERNLTLALLEVITKVNGLGKTKTSAKKRKSCTSLSSTASAVAPSKKPETA